MPPLTRDDRIFHSIQSPLREVLSRQPHISPPSRERGNFITKYDEHVAKTL